jgi:uncharacterized linocin/CFP29 family protein
MHDLLKRSLAPLTPDAWEEVDSTAARVLKGQLSARKLVDLDGPHGAGLGAANLGRLEISDTKAPGGVPWGLREVQPLVEVRIPFFVGQMELDNISRGCKDADLSDLEAAARKLVLFEETAIYRGFEAGHIEGIATGAEHEALPLPSDAADLVGPVAEGVKLLSLAGVGGPYALVLGAGSYYPLMQAGKGGYPPKRIIRDALGGEILWSPALDGGLLLSTRGGDFELIVGQDAAIGYAMHDRDKVELYLTESFTLRVLDPAAAVPLRADS